MGTDNKITGSVDMYRIEKAINFTKDTFWLIFTRNFYFNKSVKYRWSNLFCFMLYRSGFNDISSNYKKKILSRRE